MFLKDFLDYQSVHVCLTIGHATPWVIADNAHMCTSTRMHIYIWIKI